MNKENIRPFLKDTNDMTFSHILGATEVQLQEVRKQFVRLVGKRAVLKGQLTFLLSHNLSVCHMPVLRLVEKRKDKHFKENIYNNI